MSIATLSWAMVVLMIYFTSDQHFYHKNVIKYSGRDYTSLDEMHADFVSRHNSAVNMDDVIYMLGDFAFAPKVLMAEMLAKLNGYKILVRGNHDRSTKAMLDIGFDEVYTSHTLQTDAIEIYMRHIPDYEGKYDLHLCGHVHEKWKTHPPLIINVGVDQWDYAPVSLDEILALRDGMLQTEVLTNSDQ